MTTAERRPDGRQARWEQHKQERRRAILDAAIRVVEDAEPGAEYHVHQIAQRAGMSRTVVYRHFEDRADLDRGLRTAILEDLWESLVPQVRLDGTAMEIIERIVGTYVAWAVEHPALHRMAESADGDEGPLAQATERIAGQVAELLLLAVELLGATPSDDERSAIDPLVFGLVGSVFASVRRWMSRPVRTPDVDVFVDLLTDSVWQLIGGFARRLGIDLDPHVPIEQLFTVQEVAP